jgi:CheY-like chemotaxis protein
MKANAVYPLLYFAGAAVIYLAPLIIGIFWGAPMVAREIETGTFRLTWNQSITRTRWLMVKLAIAGLAAMTFAGLASLMVTWWASPIDAAGGFPVGISQLSRFQPEIFGARGIVPIGAAALAFTLGVTAGTLIRRMLPAMAVTLGLFAAALVAMPLWVSPHLITPAQYTHPITANLVTMQMTGDGQINDPVTTMPGAWILSDQVITKTGQVFVLPSIPACQTGTQQQCDAWLASQPLRQHVSYQPASRYWLFQWFETAIWLAISLALTAACRWRIKTLLSERPSVPGPAPRSSAVLGRYMSGNAEGLFSFHRNPARDAVTTMQPGHRQGGRGVVWGRYWRGAGMRVLVVEDDVELADAIATGLRQEQMAVDVANDGTAGLERALFTDYDVIVLDRDLPGRHGDEVCAELVKASCRSRVLMLTAAATIEDRVGGLGLGADDYLPKPFAFAEFVARLRALLRRAQPALARSEGPAR